MHFKSNAHLICCNLSIIIYRAFRISLNKTFTLINHENLLDFRNLKKKIGGLCCSGGVAGVHANV